MVESNFDNEIRSVIRSVRRFKKNALINILLVKVAKLDKSGSTSELQHWSLLFLIELCFLYGEQIDRRNPCENDVIQIINRLWEICNFSPYEGTPDGFLRAYKTMRNLFFQQIFFQEKINTTRFGKELNLFLSLSNSEKYNQWFNEIYGMDIEIYFFNYFVFIASVEFSNVNPLTLSGYVDWINKIAVNWDSVQNLLSKFIQRRKLEPTNRNQELELIIPPIIDFVWDKDDIYHKSFFYDYPILEKDGNYIVVSRLLAQDSLLKRPYRELKAHYKGEFRQIFGNTFESYLKLGLDHRNLQYLTEPEIQKLGCEKPTDFIIFQDDTIIIIEAKAVEMAMHLQVHSLNEDLQKSLKSSILKAYKQIHVVAKKLKELYLDKNIFSLIVTYDNLSLGPGRIAWKEWISSAWSNPSINKEYADQTFMLAPENVFIMSSDDFDYLMQVSEPLHIILKEVRKNDNWWLFGHNLKSYTYNGPLSFHTDAIHKFVLERAKKMGLPKCPPIF